MWRTHGDPTTPIGIAHFHTLNSAVHRWASAFSDNNSIGGLKLSICKPTPNPYQKMLGTFLWADLIWNIHQFLPSHHLEIRQYQIFKTSIMSEVYCHFHFVFVFVFVIDVRYGKDGALNPASNNHYELGTAPLSLARSKLAESEPRCQRKLLEIMPQIWRGQFQKQSILELGQLGCKRLINIQQTLHLKILSFKERRKA